MAYVWCSQCNEGLGLEPEFTKLIFFFDEDDWEEELRKWYWHVNKHYCRHGNCFNRACERCHRTEPGGLEQVCIIGYSIE